MSTGITRILIYDANMRQSGLMGLWTVNSKCVGIKLKAGKVSMLLSG